MSTDLLHKEKTSIKFVLKNRISSPVQLIMSQKTPTLTLLKGVLQFPPSNSTEYNCVQHTLINYDVK